MTPNRPPSDILDARVTDPQSGGASFSLRHRLTRALWSVTWALCASWTPPQMRAWRRFLLTLFGARLARSANIYASATVWYPPNLEMGPRAALGPDAICYCMAPIRLGADCVVSQGAHLCAGTHDIDDPYFQLYAEPIVIGPRAWIAAEAFIGPGVTVGEGAVAGARAVCMKDLDAWTVYAGNPARAIRKRRSHAPRPDTTAPHGR